MRLLLVEDDNHVAAALSAVLARHGFDVDVATYVAKELGHAAGDIQWVQAPSAQRETLISTGQVNMIAATYSITDERKEKVDFAGPYLLAHQDLLVKKDSDITCLLYTSPSPRD